MTTGLSDYQIAVLQAMNIQVLQKQETHKPTSPQSQVTQPAITSSIKPKVVSKADAQSRLASLKASMSPAAKSNPATSAPLNDASESKPMAEINKPNKQPVGESLSAFKQDIAVAFELINVNASPLLFVGEQLHVGKDEIVLNAQPDTLSPKQKRQLWQAMIALT